MKVKALHDHMNGYGAAPEKTAGTIYEVPEDHAATLIAAGHCEQAGDEAEITPAPTSVDLDVSVNIDTDQFEDGMATAEKAVKGKKADGAKG